MKIQDRTYVGIEYALTLDSGEIVDRSEEGDALGFIVGSGQIISGLEKALQGMETGQKAQVTVEPEEGYGEPNPALYRDIPRDNFPEDLDIQPGMGFEAKGPHGPVQFRVKSADGETVVADFNHPLAGQRLHFDVEVVEVREPRAEELSELMQSSGCDTGACGSCGGGCG